MGNTGFLLSCNRALVAPLKLQLETQGSSRFTMWDSGFHSSHGGKLGVPPELQWDPLSSFLGGTRL